MDLSKSLILDIKKQCGNEEKAARVIKGLRDQEQKEKLAKVQYLATTFAIKDKSKNKLIEQVLQSCNWDIEKSFGPMLEALEKEKTKKQNLSESDEKKSLARKDANKFLSGLFPTIPCEKIQRTLNQHHGDVEATTNALLNMAMLEQKQEKQEKKQATPFQSTPKTSPLTSLSFKEKPKSTLISEQKAEMKGSTKSSPPNEENKKEQKYSLPAIQNTGDVCQATLGSPHVWKLGMCSLCGISQIAQSASMPLPISISPMPSPMDKDKKLVKRELEKNPIPEVIKTQSIDKKTESPSDDLQMEFDVVETSKFSLHATPEWQQTGNEPIQVTWQAHEDTITTPRDWIGLYRLDSFDRYDPDHRSPCSLDQFLSWNWIHGGSKDKDGNPVMKGIIKIPTPTLPGRYVCQYYTLLPGASYCCKAISNTILVGPKFCIKTAVSSIPSSSPSVRMPTKILVNVQQVSTEKKFGNDAWVGLYRAEKGDGLFPRIENKSYYAFDWISNGTDVPVSSETQSLNTVEKQLSFEVPKAGQWHFRLYCDRSYTDVSSTSIHIPGEDRLELSVSEKEMKVDCYINTVDPSRDSVWVGIYKIEEKDQQRYRRYNYLNSTSTTTSTSAPYSSLVFRAPVHTGTYEARLFANKSYEVLTRSEPVAIHGIS